MMGGSALPEMYPDEFEHEPRPTLAPHRAPPKRHIVRKASLQAAVLYETPEPPCTGCPRYDLCAARRQVCDAWRQYISRGWKREATLPARGRRIQPMKKFRD